MMHLINFKNNRQADEWKDARLDGRLRVIIYALAGFVFDNFQKFLVITEVYRTEEERRAIYANDAVMREKVGVHEVWRGIDVRALDFTKEEIDAMVDFLNSHFEYTGKCDTVLAHDIVGFHLHIQVDGDGVTSIKASMASNG
jgi:hypothetical protein